MNKKEIFEKLNGIFRDVFDDEDLKVEETTTAEDVEGWDSLTHIRLLAAAEDEFNIKFDLKTVLDLKDVGAMVELIAGML